MNTGNPVKVTFTRNDHWRQEMDWLQNTYIPRRNNTLLSQFRAIGLWPGVKAPALDLNGGTVASGFQLTVTDPNGAGGVVYYTLDGSDPMAGIPDAIVIPLATPASICRYKVPASQYVSPDGGNSNAWKSVIPPDDIASW